MKKHAIAIHGGAGTILRSAMDPKKELAYRKALEAAVMTGDQILSSGGTALDAVQAAIISLEDEPLFNAGRGAVFTNEGKHEMDASIMDGKSLKAGAVAGISNVRNPILLARAVMDRSEHVLLAGSGAMSFAKSVNAVFEPNEYFYVQARYDQLQEAVKAGTVVMDHNDDKKFGTVGAVALDLQGNLAAGTSTGGMTNKKHGRVGDTPLVGAGTYANDLTCAVSCTGHGEFFIRGVVAYDISCLMEYKGFSLQEAAAEEIGRAHV